jgi:hypothetical protein
MPESNQTTYLRVETNFGYFPLVSDENRDTGTRHCVVDTCRAVC